MDTININDMLKLRRQQIVAQVMGGKKVPDLAREMGLTRQAIYKLLHAEGVYLRKHRQAAALAAAAPTGTPGAKAEAE